MNLDIYVDKKYYKSDSIAHGRIVANFFEVLSKNIFNQSYRYWKELKEIAGIEELPILLKERNLYSTIAVAIGKITPILLSEWSFAKKEYELDRDRRVDFYCLNRDGDYGKPINYWIELKKGWYCLSSNSKEDFVSSMRNDIKSLVDQVKKIKDISPNWEEIDDVYLGLTVIHGYHNNKSEAYYDETQIRENLYNEIDKRHNAQLITSTWHLPKNINIMWGNDRFKFVTIAGVVITQKIT